MDNSQKESALDLTFSPNWARQSVSKWVLHEKESGKPSKRERRRNDAHKGAGDQGRFLSDKPRKKDYGRKYSGDARRPSEGNSSNLAILFIPERRGLKPLVKQLAGTQRAYSLFDVAATFLSRPEFYAAAIASRPGNGRPVLPLYQCTQCKAVFTNRPMAVSHGIHQHFDLFYEKEVKEGEAPQGKFLCVARCPLSNELLGPPNYHTFNEKLQELHHARFPQMPIEIYRNKIVNETDPALIERWKKEAARKTIYRTKLPGTALVFERGFDVERHFNENYASMLIRESQKFIMPATAVNNLDDPQIKHSLQEALRKESHFPINLAFAIQQRFRRLGLHFFKTSANTTFVSAVKPHPINATQATGEIRHILEWLGQNNNKTRQDLVAALAPGMVPESEQVAGLINSLVWLIDRGHVIEFMNGTLMTANHIKLISHHPPKSGQAATSQQP
jgi:hypothetical protein